MSKSIYVGNLPWAAQAAIEALDNYSFGGRTLRVNEAKPRAPRPPRY